MAGKFQMFFVDVKLIILVFSIGAGRGNFEKTLVQDLGLKLKYICAIEPNPNLAGQLDEALKSLGTEYNIIRSYFDKEFELEEASGEKFDLILFSHSLYAFQRPQEAVLHAANFLNPGGKILIIIQGAGACPDVVEYLASRSDPEIYSLSKLISDNSLTAEKLLTPLEDKSANLSVSVMEEPVYEYLDDFVRKSGAPGCYESMSFFLQAEYEQLSEETKEYIHRTIANNCVLKDGKYHWRQRCVGVVVSNGDDQPKPQRFRTESKGQEIIVIS